jgi:hypothetical protein
MNKKPKLKSEEIIYKLTEDIQVFTSEGMQTWDKGERFVLVDAEKKRHATGKFPKRLISLSDGSMIAFAVIERIEEARGRYVRKAAVFKETNQCKNPSKAQLA